ncbi:MAG TPA: hypothetical protein DEF47_19955 [Herpetosiphon sp.]|uniref:Ig family protein n=1 Tax=Herpetosiphon aurantiacus (strain ATCC 23779 / DSM 785 / 114-95) TaxID=316274 RepID=A9B3P7_HERA2|nr:choice-of-anchor I family protein [Herpetosiphon sp.]ABX05619.1 Ig family protein [Herpetosiphon aurantiacus DSM 785]HBW52168.1 hypothetical protein [Herpetosiphon sp.]
MRFRRTAYGLGLSLLLATLPHASLATPALTTTGVPTDPTPAIKLTRIGRYNPGPFRSADPRAAEIVDFDPQSQRMVLINGFNSALDIVDLSNPANPQLLTTIAITPTSSNVPNSVAVHNGLVAVAANAAVKTDPGRVVLFNRDGVFLNEITVGAVPDMLTFTPDGRRIVVAIEGEPNSYNQVDSVDPEGAVAIIDLPQNFANITTTSVLSSSLVGFTDFNLGGSRHAELDPQIRIFGPNASVAQDLEPEYLTISADSSKAYVTLQENNGLALIDLNAGRVQWLKALGYKNHNLAGYGLDPSDSDGMNAIAPWPVLGMYQPDTINSYAANNQTYLVTANEGDARDYTGFTEEVRIKNVMLDSSVFTNAASLQQDAQLGRLNITNTKGNFGGQHHALYSFGARSFSIWDGTTGQLVFDSGDDLETRTAATFPNNFNANNTAHSRDNRSDDKGPEPEALAVATIDGRSYAFVGLERMGGIMAYDVSNPHAPQFLEYFAARSFPSSYVTGTPDDLGPEGMHVIAAEDSPTGKPLLLVANEVSGSVSIYQISAQTPRMHLNLSDGLTSVQPNTSVIASLSLNNQQTEPSARPATEVQVQYLVPSQLSYNGCTIASPLAGTCSQQNGLVTFNLTTPFASASQGLLQVATTVKPNATGTIEHQASLSYRDAGELQTTVQVSDTTTIGVAPLITSGLPTAASYGAIYSHTLTASGMPTPTLNLVGNLPAGLSFDSQTGILAGTPTTSGSFPNLIFQVSNGIGTMVTQSFTLTVAKAPLQVVADNQRRLFGQPNPPLSYQVTGLRLQDTAASALTGTLTTTATLTSPLGEYPISQGSLQAQHYQMSFSAGILTIEANAVYLPLIGK